MKKSTIKINNIEIKNRLVMPPMASGKADDKGDVTKELVEFYDQKSKGGNIGLIIMEHGYIDIVGKANFNQLSICENSDKDGLKELVDKIHKNGSKVFAQLNHAGSAAKQSVTGYRAISSSPIRLKKLGSEEELPIEMEKSHIDKLVYDFVNATKIALDVGFDGVELHSAHGYLLNQFYSPLANKRTDEFCGNTIEGRIRLHKKVIKSIRTEIGMDYPLALRLGGCDYVDGGSTIEDCVKACIEFERCGIDLLDISGGFCGFHNPNSDHEGYFSEMSEAVKAKVDIPVILTGGVKTKSGFEGLLNSGKADLIGVGRGILLDSSLSDKIING